RAADHDLVVAATRAVGVEVLALDAVLHQVPARGRVRLEGAGRRDVVRRDRIAQLRQDARAGDVRDRGGLERHALEVRGLPDVGRLVVPLEDVAGRGVQLLPAGVTV